MPASRRATGFAAHRSASTPHFIECETKCATEIIRIVHKECHHPGGTGDHVACDNRNLRVDRLTNAYRVTFSACGPHDKNIMAKSTHQREAKNHQHSASQTNLFDPLYQT
jgi:hypothetical protein